MVRNRPWLTLVVLPVLAACTPPKPSTSNAGIKSISPTRGAAGAPRTITVSGQGLSPTLKQDLKDKVPTVGDPVLVRVDGEAVDTTFVSDSLLKATLPAALSVGDHVITASRAGSALAGSATFTAEHPITVTVMPPPALGVGVTADASVRLANGSEGTVAVTVSASASSGAPFGVAPSATASVSLSPGGVESVDIPLTGNAAGDGTLTVIVHITAPAGLEAPDKQATATIHVGAGSASTASTSSISSASSSTGTTGTTGSGSGSSGASSSGSSSTSSSTGASSGSTGGVGSASSTGSTGSSGATGTPLAVTATSPVDGATFVDPRAVISVTFDQAVNPVTVSTNTSDASCSGSLQVSSDDFATCVQMAAAPGASAGNATFTVTPTSALQGATTYQIRVTTSVQSVSGVSLAGAFSTVIGFTTETVAPSGLAYTPSALVCTLGSPCSLTAPSSDGGTITAFAINPTLPAGLALDPSTGAISGTPTALSPATVYAVQGSNSAGQTTAQVTVTVNDVAPTHLDYTTNPASYALGWVITPNTPIVTGGNATAFSVAPALPAGLSLDPATGVITGTPSELFSSASYTVTASNSGGSVTGVLVIEVIRVFRHPGLLHTQPDFDRMSTKVGANESPWIDGWNRLIANNHASLTWTPHPVAVIYRNDGVHPDNYMGFANDVAAAYACALRWKVSGDTAYADKAVQIMNAWSSTLTAISWNNGYYDGFLVAGIQGNQFANVGEIMRDYAGLTAADFASFQSMMLNVFYPMVSGIFTTPNSVAVYSNWELSYLNAALAIAVLCDDWTKFDAAINYFKTGLGNGALPQVVYYVHPGYLGQTQESGRDQGHDTLSIVLLTTLCEMAWNQGVDLYGYDNNRVLAAAEYVAKGNLIESGTTYYTVPFVPYTNGSATFTVFSTGSQGAGRPEWALIYNHYVNRKGLAAPYTEKFMLLTQPEGGGGNYGPNSGGYDQLGYGTLAYTRDPIATGAPPSGLTATVSQGQVVLSWWGTAYATSYNVKRSSTAGGPYTTVASGITDLLTYTDPSLAAGTYYYVVTAETPSGETAQSNEARAVTAVQLQTYLAFDEGSGSSAADSSNSGHAATLVDGGWGAGKTGQAVSLNGTDAYVSLPDDLMVDVADFTIATWVYLNASSTWARVFDFGTGTSHYMYLTPRNNHGVVHFAITANLGVGEQVIDGNAALPTGQWVHVAVTLSGGVGTLYVNGQAVGTNNAMTLAPFRLGHTGQNWLGRSQFAADPHFNGLIDDFRIYYGALSAAEIAAL